MPHLEAHISYPTFGEAKTHTKADSVVIMCACKRHLWCVFETTLRPTGRVIGLLHFY